MLLLGIDTSTPRPSVALADHKSIIASADLGVSRKHAEFLAPAIDFCLTQSGRRIQDLTGVAVGVGPGLYTGLRVGLATAKTIAAARDVPTVGICGLDVLAFDVRTTNRLICAAIDARRGELFWAFYRPAPGGVQRLQDIAVGPPEKVAAEISSQGEDVLIVGDGALAHPDAFDDLGNLTIGGTAKAYPSAKAILGLAQPRFMREETTRAEDLEPMYLRGADVSISWASRDTGGAVASGSA